MTPIELLALTRLLNDEEKAIRAQVLPGNYDVNFTVRVSGPIEVEEDHERRSTVGVPWTEAYALLRLVAIRGLDNLISRVDRGETIGKLDLEAIKTAGFLSEDIMVETMQEAWELKQARKAKGSIMDRVPEVEAAAEKVKELIAGRLGMMPCKGRVLADLTVEEVNQPKISTAEIAERVAPNPKPPVSS
jgi:hypothetical protein